VTPEVQRTSPSVAASSIVKTLRAQLASGAAAANKNVQTINSSAHP
jgi:hypothetical protein